jgi:hypothetical protein
VNYGDRVSNLAKRLEVALYRNASSLVRSAPPLRAPLLCSQWASDLTLLRVQEEYANLETLNHRVSRTAKTMFSSQAQPDHAQASLAHGQAQSLDGTHRPPLKAFYYGYNCQLWA